MILATILAVSISGQARALPALIDELARLSSDESRRSIAGHLHDCGDDAGALKVLESVEKRPPGTLYELYLKDGNVAKLIWLLYYRPNALPAVIEDYIHTGDDSLYGKCIDIVQKADRDGVGLNLAEKRDYELPDRSQLLDLVLAFFQHGLPDAAVKVLKQHVSEGELAANFESLKRRTVIPNNAPSLARNWPEKFTAYELAELGVDANHIEIRELAVKALLERPVEWPQERYGSRPITGAFRLVTKLHEEGKDELANKIVSRHWAVLSSDFAQPDPDPSGRKTFLQTLRDLGRKDLLLDLFGKCSDRGWDETRIGELSDEQSRRAADRIKTAIVCAFLAGDDAKSRAEFNRFGTVFDKDRIVHSGFEALKLDYEGTLEELVSFAERTKVRGIYFIRMDSLLYRLKLKDPAAAKRFAERIGRIELASKDLQSWSIHASRMLRMGALGVAREEMRRDEDAYGFNENSALMGFVVRIAAHDDELAAKHFDALDLVNRPHALRFALYDWKELSDRPLRELCSIAGRDLLAEALDKLRQASVENTMRGQALETCMHILDLLRDEPALTNRVLDHLHGMIASLPKGGRKHFDQAVLAGAIGRGQEGFSPLPLATQERIYRSVIATR